MLYPAAVSCLALLLYTATIANCGRMRARHAIAPPATAGHVEFEKSFRVQMNTLEQLALFLPAMWLYAIHISEPWGAGIGVLWVLARIHYALGYQRDPKGRLPGVAVSFAINAWLLVGAICGIARAML